VPSAGEVPAKAGARFVERLVQGTARGTQTVGEDVDRHPVDEEGKAIRRW
jgi:hypothetical protein